MKYEWKKQDKHLYQPKNKPEILTIPSYNYFMVSGKGNPNHEAYAEAIGVLYSLSYGVKMMPKSGKVPDGYYEYSIFPLEGVWDLSEEGKRKTALDKDELLYTIMIRQPDFVTSELADEVIEIVKRKKPHPLLEKASFSSLEEGLCIQMLHLGHYDEEPHSFAIMEQYCTDNGLQRTFHTHKEIYLNDARKTHPDKLKTVLRFKAHLLTS
ncbi:GyrI-like domain-containing protein [Paenibacillus wynnii]|uniref:GyrI-like small molecule binding domain-containing protein n=1 Tax=Paenibacillus wynnii TaxID=268407 RepID=A0A098M6R5_9BACL|nr:GyrI-like domain-containing protein [Paenibacillus wynnii]KGE17723.1 hypothetical protein PWYN_24455 [Paenibacillus wynnii]